MSIRQNQEFTYETDTLADFEQMLFAVIPMLFAGKGCGWQVYEQQQPWGDEYPGETAYLLGCDMEDDEAKAMPIFYHVGEVTDRISGRSLQDLVQSLIDALRLVDPADFVARCSKEGPFEGHEGMVVMGYRMHFCTYRGDRLLISLCHIYYGK